MAQSRSYATKKKGKTEVYPFWNMSDIKNTVEWFERKGDWDGYLITLLGLLLGRRIGDTVMLKWSDFYYENGEKKTEINTIEEQKTGKTTNIPVSDMVFESIEKYLSHIQINPMENLDCYMFMTNAKKSWLRDIEQMGHVSNANDIDSICDFYGKDYSDQRKEKIVRDFKNQQIYESLIEFFNYEVMYDDVVKWQTDDYRKRLKKAARDCDVKTRISTHSLRKSFGYWIHKMHQYDPDCLLSLQKLFNHSDLQTTMNYIGLTEEKNRQYINDHGNFIRNVLAGKGDEIVKNMPVISLKSDDFGNILMEMIKAMNNGCESVEVYQLGVNMANELRIV